MINRLRTVSPLLVALPLLLALAATVHARSEASSQQREDFLDAEQALAEEDMAEYLRLAATLQDYPLYPYLVYSELSSRLEGAGTVEVQDFLSRYRNTPLEPRLRAAWLKTLKRQQRWAELVRFYRPTKDAARRCDYLNALMRTGHRERALRQTEPLWLHGKSRPESCDPLFEAWRGSGHLTESLVWARIDLAMQRNQTRLARYLGRFLGPDDRRWLERWLRIHRDPGLITSTVEFRHDHPRRGDIQVHGLKLLARRDAGHALRAWQDLSRRFRFSASQRAQAESALAIALAREGRPQAMTFMARIQPDPENLRLHHTRVRTALLAGDWHKVLEWIEALPEAERTKERWRYWRGRALWESGEARKAKDVLAELATSRGYYGFLAADRLGAEYNLSHRPLAVEAGRLAAVEQIPGVRRARELLLLDRGTHARREWHYATRDMSDADLKAAAKLAQQWGWHDQAIFTLARTGYWDDLELRFPLKHRERIEALAKRKELDSAWVFAVVRQESAFAHDAISPAGALGLMQLMPGTARHVARKNKISAPRRADLFDPETNIRFGTSYLSEVLGELNENLVLATAAYNAGPRRIKNWLPENRLEAELWIESVPFKETRTYLRRVLAYTVIFEHRMGKKPTRLTDRMHPVGGDALSRSAVARDAGVAAAQAGVLSPMPPRGGPVAGG